MNEFEFIKNLLTPLAAKEEISFSFKDDCCLLPHNQYVLTSDIIVENTHFLPTDPPKSIAHKLINVNISDLVSKASYPKFYSLNLTLNKFDKIWLSEFCEELRILQNKYNFSLIGGDTTKGLNLVISANFFAEKENKILPLVTNAKANNAIFVSGTIGNSYIGLLSRLGKIPENTYFEEYYLYPNARLDLIEIIKKYAISATDISDGLAIDLIKILKASNLGAEITLKDNLFQDQALKISSLEDLVTAGDDYQIIMLADLKDREEIEKNSDFKYIGKTTKSAKITIKNSQGENLNLEKTGYIH